MGRLRFVARSRSCLVFCALYLALFCAGCTTWFITFEDASGAHHRLRWLSCSGRCDAAFSGLVTKEDTQVALDKLAFALDNLPSYERETAAAIHWNRAVLRETRGEWLLALRELDAAVGLAPSPEYAAERASMRRRLGISLDGPVTTPRDTDALADDEDDAEKCACLPGQSPDPPDEALLATLIEPGKGIGPIAIDRSTVNDVLRVYGCDCRITKRRRDHAVTSIDYTFVDAKGGLGSDAHRPGRAPNATRPAVFLFGDGLVKRISLNVYQKNLATADGLRVRGTKADMTRALGDGFRLESTKLYEKYRYRALGIDVWIAHANDTVGTLQIYKP